MQHIGIYCNICCLNVVNILSLHCRNDWTFSNLDYILTIYLYGCTGCVFFSLLIKPIFSHEMSFYHNPVTYCSMAIFAIHSNTIRDTVFTCIVSPLIHMWLKMILYLSSTFYWLIILDVWLAVLFLCTSPVGYSIAQGGANTAGHKWLW